MVAAEVVLAVKEEEEEEQQHQQQHQQQQKQQQQQPSKKRKTTAPLIAASEEVDEQTKKYWALWAHLHDFSGTTLSHEFYWVLFMNVVEELKKMQCDCKRDALLVLMRLLNVNFTGDSCPLDVMEKTRAAFFKVNNIQLLMSLLHDEVNYKLGKPLQLHSFQVAHFKSP